MYNLVGENLIRTVYMIILLQVLVGNTDVQTAVTNTFNPEISARYIRVYPIKYRLRVCMRLELYGLTKCK